MPHFICPNCGNRSISVDRTAGFRDRARGCANCGFGFLFELLDDEKTVAVIRENVKFPEQRSRQSACRLLEQGLGAG